MNNRLSEIIASIRGSHRGMQVMIWLGLAGMVLILLSEFLPSGTAAKAADASQETPKEYQNRLETELTELVGQVAGAGKAKVMITLETGEENVYAVDTQEGENNAQQTHVLLDDGNALTETVRMPSVCGVAVVCEGGDQIHVVTQITDLLSSLLGISTNRISVAKMN